MKNPYLLTHVLTHIHSTVRIYGKDCSLLREASSEIVVPDRDYSEHILRHPLLRSYDPSAQPPLIFSVNETLVYSWFFAGGEFFLLGPTRLPETVTFRYKMTFPVPAAEPDEAVSAWEDTIPYCSISVFADDILLLYHIESGMTNEAAYLGARQLLAANCVYEQIKRQALREFYKTVFINVENGFAHNPYNHEVRECACIRRGDVEGLRRIHEERYPGRFGKLSEDPVRQMINIGIVTITLASRAAIEGGLHFETSFYLSDVFIQQLEACHDVMTIDSLYHNAELQYAELVHELLVKKEGDIPVMENRHISHCKDYIFAHLHEKLTVQEIAAAIGLEANYLSALFRKCEKVSLKQFILHEKIEMAKNLLAYSDFSYIHIATSLGFSSQSHLGAEFKKMTGMTLRAYRLANSEDDFVRESMEWFEDK
ncbi:MAG: helix-turn-helix transcriptional regulator [Oscillibacter sp.]|nr:helix-turn-helix transcriptional regulator [Oscillibacter sp.]